MDEGTFTQVTRQLWSGAANVRKRARPLQRLRVAWYRRRWSAVVHGQPRVLAPVLLAGHGAIRFGPGVALGTMVSPGALSGYSYIEARSGDCLVSIGAGSYLNNGICFISEGPGISLGERCIVGPGVQIFDSDFHPLRTAERGISPSPMGAVSIGSDVFLGASAIVLKGVAIGDGSVVGAGSIVSRDVPPGVVVAGNPARTIRHLAA